MEFLTYLHDKYYTGTPDVLLRPLDAILKDLAGDLTFIFLILIIMILVGRCVKNVCTLKRMQQDKSTQTALMKSRSTQTSFIPDDLLLEQCGAMGEPNP